jgi:hypothetical protein
MTLMEIRFDKPPTKHHAIFIAAGDKETFASYALQNLAAHFDILIFSYGDDAKVRAGLERNARLPSCVRALGRRGDGSRNPVSFESRQHLPYDEDSGSTVLRLLQ